MADLADAENRPAAPAELSSLLDAVVFPDGPSRDTVRARLDRLTKPPGSLGQLEDLAVQLATMLGNPPPPLTKPAVFVLAGDHGVAARGVSAYPSEVTAQMCRNFVRGGAAINAIADAVGCRVVAADFGVDAVIPPTEGLQDRKVRRGTDDLSVGPAMSRDDALAAVLRGASLIDAVRPSPDAVVLGEMGIGNSTAASAITAVLTRTPVEDVVGLGTGVGGSGLARKTRAVQGAVDRIESRADPDPLRILREAGGCEIGGLVGLTLSGARRGVPVVTDGFIATAAAALAVALAPATRDYLFAGHRSPEPGHSVLLDALDLEPILELDLRLGEGTGAALSLPILDAAGAILRGMATFEEAGVTETGARRPGGER